MPRTELDRVTEEKIASGGILVKFYFDMQSEDKEKLQPLLVDLINERLLKERGVVYCYGAIEEPVQRDKLFITSAAVHVLFESLRALIVLAFKYAPIGVEILKPQKDLKMNIWDLQSMILDLSQMSTDYSRYILEKVLGPEDVQKIQNDLKTREELGRKLIEKQKKDGAEPK